MICAWNKALQVNLAEIETSSPKNCHICNCMYLKTVTMVSLLELHQSSTAVFWRPDKGMMKCSYHKLWETTIKDPLSFSRKYFRDPYPFGWHVLTRDVLKALCHRMTRTDVVKRISLPIYINTLRLFHLSFIISTELHMPEMVLGPIFTGGK